MPEGSDLDLRKWRSDLIKIIGDHLSKNWPVDELDESTLKSYKSRRFTTGWTIIRDVCGVQNADVHFLLDQDFPYSAPRLGISDRNLILEWPHLDHDGLLCIFTELVDISFRDPVGVAEELIADGLALIEDCVSGRNEDDFKGEFLSYWAISSEEKGDVISLVEPRKENRIVSIWRGRLSQEKYYVFGDDRATLTKWLNRCGAKAPKRGLQFEDGLLIWLTNPPVPSSYPRTALNLLDLVTEQGGDALSVLEDYARRGPSKTSLLLGLDTEHGVCFAGLEIQAPKQKALLRGGFRDIAKVPKDIFLRRYFSSECDVAQMKVERADHMWIHGRDNDDRQETLRHATVCVLGCGSVGSSVANSLAAAGVSNLCLVDSQYLSWSNISRHELGAQNVDMQKAVALGNALKADYPHLGNIQTRFEHFGFSSHELIEQFPKFDLVVSTMGNWTSETILNDVQRTVPKVPPIVYGWLESNATASHALTVFASGPCLRCGFSDRGEPILRVTDTNEGDQVLQEPACGAVYTPYGPIELSWGQSLIAETVIDVLLGQIEQPEHRLWVARQNHIRKVGSKLSAEFIKEYGEDFKGGALVNRVWADNTYCPVCKRATAA